VAFCRSIYSEFVDISREFVEIWRNVRIAYRYKRINVGLKNDTPITSIKNSYLICYIAGRYDTGKQKKA
jgi:hypothetical protein